MFCVIKRIAILDKNYSSKSKIHFLNYDGFYFLIKYIKTLLALYAKSNPTCTLENWQWCFHITVEEF